jgi:hypothetical protein
MLLYQVVQRKKNCAKNKIGVKIMEFSDVLSWSGCPLAPSRFYPLTVYSSTKGLAVVGVFIQFQNRHWLSSCFGANDGIEHGGMHPSDCVSMSGLHNGQNFCHIGREILTLARFFPQFSIPPPHFTPKIGGGEDGWIFGWGFLCLVAIADHFMEMIC